jgi:hypothetical protein
MKRISFISIFLFCALTTPLSVWAGPTEKLAASATGLLGLLSFVVFIVLLLLGAGTYAIFWDNVLENRVKTSLSMVQQRPGRSALTGFLIILLIIVLGKLGETVNPVGGLAFILLVLAVWAMSLGLICYARWLGQRLFSEGRHPQLATAKGMMVIVLMNLVPFVGWFTTLLLCISGLGAVALCWRTGSVMPIAKDESPQPGAKA